MNFLADENFPNASIFLLEKNNHVVGKVSTLFKGIQDTEIISIAFSENEIVIAFDKDFGELIFKEQLPSPSGLVLFRFKHFEPDLPGKILLDEMKNHNLILPGHFTVISANKVRQKRLQL